MKPLTKLELHQIDMRMDEIETMLDDENIPDDVAEALISEIDAFIIILEKSMKLAMINESGLKLVK